MFLFGLRLEWYWLWYWSFLPLPYCLSCASPRTRSSAQLPIQWLAAVSTTTEYNRVRYVTIYVSRIHILFQIAPRRLKLVEPSTTKRASPNHRTTLPLQPRPLAQLLVPVNLLALALTSPKPKLPKARALKAERVPRAPFQRLEEQTGKARKAAKAKSGNPKSLRYLSSKRYRLLLVLIFF